MHQQAQQPYPYTTEEVTFRNEKDGATLAGTLTWPIGYDPKSHKKPTVVLLVTGSGQQNRDEEVFDHKPFAVIAHHLAVNGIASLRYDDRGVGKSTGSLEGLTTWINKNDAAAGIAYLRSLGKFGKVGMLAVHSVQHLFAGIALGIAGVAFVRNFSYFFNKLVTVFVILICSVALTVKHGNVIILKHGFHNILIHTYCGGNNIAAYIRHVEHFKEALKSTVFNICTVNNGEGNVNIVVKRL